MRWYITTDFQIDFSNDRYWTCNDFNDALELSKGLIRSVDNVWIWKATTGNPIKWMEVKQ